jgi:hypothetical protein
VIGGTFAGSWRVMVGVPVVVAVWFITFDPVGAHFNYNAWFGLIPVTALTAVVASWMVFERGREPSGTNLGSPSARTFTVALATGFGILFAVLYWVTEIWQMTALRATLVLALSLVLASTLAGLSVRRMVAGTFTAPALVCVAAFGGAAVPMLLAAFGVLPLVTGVLLGSGLGAVSSVVVAHRQARAQGHLDSITQPPHPT